MLSCVKTHVKHTQASALIHTYTHTTHLTHTTQLTSHTTRITRLTQHNSYYTTHTTQLIQHTRTHIHTRAHHHHPTPFPTPSLTPAILSVHLPHSTEDSPPPFPLSECLHLLPYAIYSTEGRELEGSGISE